MFGAGLNSRLIEGEESTEPKNISDMDTNTTENISYEIRSNPRYIMWKNFVRINSYGWSHSRCNKIKNSMVFVELQYTDNKFEYVINEHIIEKFASIITGERYTNNANKKFISDNIRGQCNWSETYDKSLSYQGNYKQENFIEKLNREILQTNIQRREETISIFNNKENIKNRLGWNKEYLKKYIKFGLLPLVISLNKGWRSFSYNIDEFSNDVSSSVSTIESVNNEKIQKSIKEQLRSNWARIKKLNGRPLNHTKKNQNLFNFFDSIAYNLKTEGSHIINASILNDIFKTKERYTIQTGGMRKDPWGRNYDDVEKNKKFTSTLRNYDDIEKNKKFTSTLRNYNNHQPTIVKLNNLLDSIIQNTSINKKIQEEKLKMIH